MVGVAWDEVACEGAYAGHMGASADGACGVVGVVIGVVVLPSQWGQQLGLLCWPLVVELKVEEDLFQGLLTEGLAVVGWRKGVLLLLEGAHNQDTYGSGGSVVAEHAVGSMQGRVVHRDTQVGHTLEVHKADKIDQHPCSSFGVELLDPFPVVPAGRLGELTASLGAH